MEYLVAVANVSEGTFIQRPMTEAELLQDEKDRKLAEETRQAEAQAQAEAAAAKAALLERLGITEEEAKLLLS